VDALPKAVEERGLLAHLVVEIAGRFRSHHQLLGTMVGGMLPALLGCRPPSELCRVRGWDKQWPSRMLGALPTRSWLKRLRRLGLEGLEPIWRHVHANSPATQRRWPWTWVWEDAGLHTYGAPLELVGRCWSGQPKRVVSGMDGVWLLVGGGEGRWIGPVDCAMRRPDPVGAWGPVPGHTALGPAEARRALGSVPSAWRRGAGTAGGGREVVERRDA
jgi:hypothetical protein